MHEDIAHLLKSKTPVNTDCANSNNQQVSCQSGNLKRQSATELSPVDKLSLRIAILEKNFRELEYEIYQDRQAREGIK